MEPLIFLVAIIIVCAFFIIRNRHLYKDWKNQSHLMKNIMFFQVFGLILFSLVLLIILFANN